MDRLILVLLISYFSLLCIPSHAQNKDTIYWDANRKLNWVDFKGKADKTTNLLAMTQAGIGYEVNCNNGELRLNIFCYFNEKESWTKETDSQDLLNHEQGHFNITELFARKLRKKLSEVSDPCGKNYKELNKIYQSNFNECAKEQNVYDKETNHSVNKMKQKEWEETISKELKALENYSGNNY